jgi:hypothetical protein
VTFWKGLEPIQERAQSRESVLGEEVGSQPKPPLAIGGLLGNLERGEAEGFGVAGFWFLGGGAWVLLGERFGEVVDGGCREGLKRDGCFSLCHRVDFTSVFPISEHPP